MARDGGPRAWAFLRRNPAYRAAWRAVDDAPVLEAAPFPVRIRSKADGHAGAWGLLAWKGPDRTGGVPSSPFWAQAPMLQGTWASAAPPLAGLLARSGARLDGLRLADGTLILKIENGPEAVQVRVGARTCWGAGLALRLGLGHADALALLHDAWRLVGEPRGDPRRRPKRSDGELLSVLDARLAGKSWRETATGLYGAERVAEDWSAESWMRSRVRRRGKKARLLMEGGYLDLVARR